MYCVGTGRSKGEMSEVKDPRIRLFGKTIELPEISDGFLFESFTDGGTSRKQDGPESEKVHSVIERYNSMMMMVPGDLRLLSVENDAQGVQTSITEEQAEGGVSLSPEKLLKKPEMVLPCPRCDSMDTKFCYFNNYNTNQPRHFCKSCQRYWTAGGTMRNVPFGAGRRKNKNSVAQFRHVNASDHPNGLRHLIALSSDSPVCDSMVSSSDIADETVKNGSSNGFHRNREQGESDPSSSEFSIASSKDMIGKKEQNLNCQQQVPCFPGSLWPPYQWHPVTFPPRFYSAGPFIGCAVPGSWTIPWIIPTPCSGSPSPAALGKHSRDDETLEENSSVLSVPKTARIEDNRKPGKRGIINKDGADSATSISNLFKGLQGQPKDKETHDIETSAFLQVNPAALSRFLSFHESS